MAAIKAEGLVKAFPNGFNLRADLEFLQGRAYGLLGANGAGKTTLLLLLGLLERPDAGRLYFHTEAAGRRNIGNFRREMVMVMEEPYFFSGSARENVAYGLRLRKAGPEQERKRTAFVLRRLGLAEVGGEDARSLSQGQKRRLDIARALAIRPRIIFLDEPFAHIDKQSSEIIQGIIKGLRRDGSVTIIFTTHSVNLAFCLADKVIYLERGRVIKEVDCGIGRAGFFC